MRKYEVSAQDLLDRRSLEYLRCVIRDVQVAALRDPFFDAVKASYKPRHTKRPPGSDLFLFRFDPEHQGSPGRGRQYAIDLRNAELRAVAGGQSTILPARVEDLAAEDLLLAVREMFVRSVLDM